MRPMVFIGAAAEEVRALRAGAGLPDGPAFAATPQLREAFDYGPDAGEDADYAAQIFASLECLRAGADRLVLAFEVDRLPPASGVAGFGQVRRPDVGWADLRALFVDEPGSRPALRAYAESVRGRDLPALWADERLASLIGEHDLLWFDPTELDQALTGLAGPKGGD